MANLLKNTFHIIFNMLHPIKNGLLNVDKLTYGSNKVVHWQCSNGHETEESVKAMTSRGRCKLCTNVPKEYCAIISNKPRRAGALTLKDYNDAAEAKGGKYLGVRNEKDEIVPNFIPLNSQDNRATWSCKYNHVFSAAMMHIPDSWCSVCAGNCPIVLYQYQNIAILKGGLYLGTKNVDGTFNPNDIPSNSHENTAYFKCKDGHVFNASYNHIKNSDTWCHQCNSTTKCLKDYKEIAILKGYKYLGVKNTDGTFNPNDIPSTIVDDAWWECNTKNHQLYTSFSKIQSNCGCSHCSHNFPKILQDYLDVAEERNIKYLGTKFDDNFVLDIPLNASDNNAWWEHEIDGKIHCWNASYNHIKNSGTGCPKCKHKTEAFLEEFLKEHYPNLIRQYKPTWAKNLKGNQMAYDFLISKDDTNVLIELDGDQHFGNVSNWKPVEETRDNDILKKDLAMANECYLLRIYQPDVSKNFTDKLKWELLTAIQNCFTLPNAERNVFLSNDENTYRDFYLPIL